MSLIELVLNKKGPLAKVWISAHHERKLTKAQALQVDVSESVEAILEQEVEPIALRMSGQLMLGVVRIYSRKVQYLFDDCKEARERIVMAFRPGAVDLPEDQLRASKAAITLPDKGNDFDFLLNDLDWTFDQEFRRKANQAGADGAPALPRFNRVYAVSERSLSVERQSEAGIDSQEIGGIMPDEDMDLGLDLGDETFSLEFARDAQSKRASSVGSELRIGGLKDGLGRSMSREQDDTGLGADPMSGIDIDEPMDLGLDMGEGFDFGGNDGMDLDVPMLEPDNAVDEDRARRESTRLTTPPPLAESLADHASMATITPRTAARITKMAEDREAAAAKSATKERPKKKVRIMAADEEIELQLERGQRRDLSGILADENYVPADEAVGMLLQVRNDPQAFFLPTIQRGGQSYFVGGLPGIAPGLSELFTFPTNVLRRGQDRDIDEDDRRKRQRTGGDEDPEASVEFGRRADSRALSERPLGLVGKDVGAFDDTLDFGGGGGFGDMGAGFELGLDDAGAQQSIREPSAAPSLAQTEKLHASDEDCLIAIFDSRQQTGGASQTATQTGASTIADESASAASRRRNGYSQNTVRAEGIIRQQVGVEKDGFMEPPSEGESGEMSFEKVAAKGSRRAAASFFFELLVLGTRDNIKIKQDESFGDIKVSSKPGLWANAAGPAGSAIPA